MAKIHFSELRIFKNNRQNATLRHHNLRLWLLLACVPIAITIIVFLYGNLNLDSSIIKESDSDLDNDWISDKYEVETRSEGLEQRMNNTMKLPKTNTTATKTTTKEDKRLLDEYGDMVTVEVTGGQTLEGIAKDKLGHEAFWVFLFDVNRDKLNSPTDLKAGMKLYVPNPEYFGFSAQDQASIQYAKRRAEEINAKQ